MKLIPRNWKKCCGKKGHEVTVTNAGANGRTSAEDAKHDVAAATDRTEHRCRRSEAQRTRRGVLVVGYPAINLSEVAASQGALYVTWGGLPGARYHVPGDPTESFQRRWSSDNGVSNVFRGGKTDRFQPLS
jgi:hypothetical protein